MLVAFWQKNESDENILLKITAAISKWPDFPFLPEFTWSLFGRLTDIQVSTHPLTVAESQTGSDETTPDQIGRVVRPLTLTNRFLALLFYLYRD